MTGPKHGFVRVNGILQPPRDVMLRRRVLSIEGFAQERRRGKLSPSERTRLFGSTTAPIPVPLAPGETEDAYERGYRAWAGEQLVDSFADSANPNRERASRSCFAILRLNNYIKNGQLQPPKQEKPPKQPVNVTNPTEAKLEGPQTDKGHSREVLNASKVVGLDQFQKFMEDGTLDKYRAMDAAECMAQFGAPIAPVFVPLALGETIEQYEDRFTAWLEHKYDTTLEEVWPKLARERNLRLYFATLNGKGFEKFVPARKTKRVREEKPKPEGPVKKSKLSERVPTSRRSMEACAGQSSLEGCTTCRCRQCLLKGIGLLAKKISGLDAAQLRRDCACEPERRVQSPSKVVDVSSDEEAASVNKVLGVDATEEVLQRNYDEINEQIVMNEKALEASVARLASEPVVGIEEMSLLQDENEEFRELILEEYGNRTAALAVLILYRTRRGPESLTKLVADERGGDVPHIQRSSHQKCAELAGLIAEKQAQREATSADQVGSEIHRLCTLRQRVFTTLIHFDQHLRQMLQSLLDQVNSRDAKIGT